jgi:hypothetical protein
VGILENKLGIKRCFNIIIASLHLSPIFIQI